jgi:hypothetical protein
MLDELFQTLLLTPEGNLVKIARSASNLPSSCFEQSPQETFKIFPHLSLLHK